MYCIRCGKQIAQNQIACDACTLELLKMEATATPVNESIASEPTYSEPVVSEPIYEAPATSEPVYEEPVVNQSAPAYTPPTYQSADTQYPNYDKGFGKALASTIMSAIGFFMSYIAMIMSIIDANFLSFPSVSALILGIISVVYGAKSIAHFKKCNKLFGRKPVATLVLGINGLSVGCVALFFEVLALVFSMTFSTIYY